ncbi:MAG: ABC-F family ATP-binding cassette domain-containing protein [Gemmataceae bacterium]|nr:ABC-F family ATP-binding cassette domain-containing protein [Gemmataceae bacterium]
MTILLSSTSLSKAYGPQPLFTDISLDLRAGERVGLIGPNGSGKSTLLKILLGLEQPDSGTVSVRRTARVGYLPQDPVFDPNRTLRAILEDARADDPSEEHERATQVSILLGKVGFADGERKAGELSGGWHKRLAVACALVRRPDLLLLDEPTNHLDLEGILWLEKLLQDASFAYLAVSHDRYFLENVTNQIIELDRVYPAGYFRVDGTYSDFLQRREEFLAGQARREQSLAAKVRREVEWLKRGAKARTGKSSFRKEAAAKLSDELQEVKTRNTPTGTVGIDFAASGRKSTKLLSAEGMTKSMGGRLLFRGLSLQLSPGTKLGLLGANGSGKSTLLRVLSGEVALDAGTVTQAGGLLVVTFGQGRRQLDRTATLRRALSPNADEVLHRGRPWHVTAWAKRFLFRPEQMDLPIGDLSGGEQARVLVARVMLQPADVLLLDEPTNDLDLPTLEVLEESLADFPGALVLVTHDRSLLDRLCTGILGLDGEGGHHLFADYGQWVAAQRSAARPTPATPPPQAARAPRAKANRLSYKEQREWDSMEESILVAEEKVAVRQREAEALSGSADPARLQACYQALHEAQEEVERLYTRWQELEAKQKPDR